MFKTYGFTPSEYGAAKKPSKFMKKIPANSVVGILSGKQKQVSKDAAKAMKQKRMSNKDIAKMLEKHTFLRDENEDLAKAFASNDMEAAWKVWKSLAKQRDKLKRKGLAAAEGKTFKQVAGRTYLGVLTLGGSELGRLAFKKKISEARKKRAKAYFDQSDAAQKLLKFWKGQFVDETKKLKSKKPADLTAKQKTMLEIAATKSATLDTVSKEGSMLAETEKPPTQAEAAKEAEAEAAVEAEAPKAAVDAAAKSEDPAAVAAPTATEGDVAEAKTEESAGGEAAAGSEGEALEKSEGEKSEGLSMNMKIGIAAAGLGLVALLALLK